MKLDVPLVNVAANPSQDSLYIWQGVLQGPIDTIYEGLILKFEIQLPICYPNSPPKVFLYSDTRITHPNIFDKGLICLDFLQQTTREKTKCTGQWNSTYSIYSILHQLQGFFYEGNDVFSKLHRIKKRRLIREEILKIKENVIEHDKNKRELIRLENEEKKKALQNIMKEEAGLKYLIARKAKEEAKNEKRREKQRAKRRERRALEREKRKKENEERVKKIKEEIRQKDLISRRELRETLREKMALEKNLKSESGTVKGSESQSQITMTRLMTDELSDKDYFKSWELQTSVYRQYMAEVAAKKAAESARLATEKEQRRLARIEARRLRMEEKELKHIQEAKEARKIISELLNSEIYEKENWPRVVLQEEFQPEEFTQTKTELELYTESLRCFSSWLNYSEAKNTGYQIDIKRRGLGEVNTTNIYTNLLCFKRFTVRRITVTPNDEKFAYWFPCFLNKDEHEKSLYIAKRSLSLMLFGNADHFKPMMILEVFIPAIYNKLLAITKLKQTPDYNSYQEIINLQTIVEIFIRNFPELIPILEAKIKAFLEDPRARSIREMEDINIVWIWALFLPSVSSISDILDVAYDELLQRQTMHILRRIPDLKKADKEDMDISDKQLLDTFEIVKEEFQRLLIFSNYADNFKKHYETNGAFLDKMESRLHKMEDNFA